MCVLVTLCWRRMCEVEASCAVDVYWEAVAGLILDEASKVGACTTKWCSCRSLVVGWLRSLLGLSGRWGLWQRWWWAIVPKGVPLSLWWSLLTSWSVAILFWMLSAIQVIARVVGHYDTRVYPITSRDVPVSTGCFKLCWLKLLVGACCRIKVFEFKLQIWARAVRQNCTQS